MKENLYIVKFKEEDGSDKYYFGGELGFNEFKKNNNKNIINICVEEVESSLLLILNKASDYIEFKELVKKFLEESSK